MSIPISSKTHRYVTPRAIILALILAVINDYWIVQMEVVRYSFATYAAPFYNCIFTLLILTAANSLVRKRFPSIALTPVELITVYVMLSITSAVCSHNMMEVLISLMGYAFFFQTPENKWGEMFLDRIPKWLTVSDMASLRNFYFGNSTLYDPVNFKPWIVPVLCWSAFCAVLLFTMLCINSILRKQWVEAERLTFPIIQLPLEMTDESGALFKNRYMWIGFAFAGGLTLLAGLNYLYPSIPCLRIVRQNVGPYIVNQPWKAIGAIMVSFYFWAIGIAFIMPLELSFSCWFFFWFTRMELVMSRVVGLNELGVMGGGFDRMYPFLTSQSYGAYIGFFVMSMWTSRHFLKRVWRTAFKGTKEEDESREAISYRAAILGALAGVLFLCGFALRMGMSLWVVVVFFVMYFVFAIIVSRIRAELGFPTHDLHVMGPQHLIATSVGTEGLARQDMIGFTLFHWFNRTYASHPAPHQMEAFKLQERTGAIARQMFVAIMIAGFVALPIGFWNLLHTYYRNGGATAHMEQWALGFGSEAWNQLAAWIRQPFGTNKYAMSFVGVGFLFSMFLGWMRVQFLWFPFHPLAYAMANGWGVAQLWVPLLIGSTAKFLALKFGGLGAYRRALPFFFGLILGEIVVGSLWTIIGVVFGIPTYDFWPGHF
jgi:hypothetical protein